MPTYDKYDPIGGGFRAKLNAALPLTNGSFFGAVSLNASGRVVVGTAGQTGLVGVVIKNVARGPITQWNTTIQGVANPNAPIGAMAGDVVDVMNDGDITGLDKVAFPAGSKVYAAADGTISTTGGTGKFLIGFIVEAGRLVVRIDYGAAAQA